MRRAHRGDGGSQLRLGHEARHEPLTLRDPLDLHGDRIDRGFQALEATRRFRPDLYYRGCLPKSVASRGRRAKAIAMGNMTSTMNSPLSTAAASSLFCRRWKMPVFGEGPG